MIRGAVEPVHVPLQIIRQGAVAAPCRLDGRRTLALIDTGASVSVIDSAFLSQRPARRFISAQAEWGRTDLPAAAPAMIELGGHSLRVANPISADHEWLRQTTGLEIGVVLGLDALSQRVVSIEPTQERLQLFTHLPALPSSFERMSLKRGPHGKLCIPAWLGRRGPVWSTFDLGSSNPLMIALPSAREWGLLQNGPMSTALTGTIFGPQVSVLGTLDSMSLSRFTLDNVPVDGFATWHDVSAPANLGAPVMLRFDMVLDMAHGGLWLRPNKTFADEFKKNRSGLGVAFRGHHLDVVHVAANSPASPDWRLDEKITAIDGRPVGFDYFSSDLCGWREAAAGDRVMLEGSFEGVRAIVLADYY